MSLLSRVMLATALIGALMLGLAAAVLLSNAKVAIEREVQDGRRLARDYVIAAVGSLLRTNAPDEAVSFLPTTLYQPRHVKITVIDLVNGVTHFPRPPRGASDDGRAPVWFERLLAPRSEEVQLPIQMGPDTFGMVIITTAPDDEIAEVWSDFRMLALIGAVTYIFTLLVLALVLRRALRPLSRIGSGFAALEVGDYGARIGPVTTREFVPLAERFDRLAETVEQSLRDKDALNRRLVEAQDVERRTIAMDLHDEFGPCLFGLRVEARAIQTAAETSGNAALKDRAESVLQIAEQIQRTNRDLLARLRPMEIGQLPLSDALSDLVARMRALGEVCITADLTRRYDGQLCEAEELQLYRILQEAITNALRHAQSSQIDVSLGPDPKDGNALLLEVVDDGSGWSGRAGSGIRGMTERAQSLGGSLTVDRQTTGGTRVLARLPLNDERRNNDGSEGGPGDRRSPDHAYGRALPLAGMRL